jgi:hypothetical protein
LDDRNYLVIHYIHSSHHFEVIEGAFGVFWCLGETLDYPNPNPEYQSIGGTPRFPERSATTRVHHNMKTFATYKTCSTMSQQVLKVTYSLLVHERI